MKTRIAYWSCQIIGWGGYSAFGIQMAAHQIGWQFHLIAGYVLFSLYSIALTDLLRRVIRRRGLLNAMNLGVVGQLFLAAVLLAAIQTFLVSAIDLAFQGRAGFALRQPSYMLATWISVTAADCMWLLFYAAITAPRRFREKEISLQLALREAELRALESQINPHFLFNCLNSIRALVVENPPVAQDMITRFANILRYNLHRDLIHTVPLASELEVVSDYLALEAVRLEDRLRFHFEIHPDAVHVPVPPMLLQMLVENALKHGIAPAPEGGDLRIRAVIERDALLLEILNSGQLTGSQSGATQVGLKNTRERLRILYGGRASLELKNRDASRVAATVLIPRTI